jgi:plasmid stability protein
MTCTPGCTGSVGGEPSVLDWLTQASRIMFELIGTLTIRVDDELAELVRNRAHEQGVSLNQFATNLLRAALDPESNGDAVESLRERLRRAGSRRSALP